MRLWTSPGGTAMTSSSPPSNGSRTADQRAIKRKGNAEVRSPKPDRSPAPLFCCLISMNGTLLHGFCKTPKFVGVANNFMQVATAEPCPSRSQSVERCERKCWDCKLLLLRPAQIHAGEHCERTNKGCGCRASFVRSMPIMGAEAELPCRLARDKVFVQDGLYRTDAGSHPSSQSTEDDNSPVR